MRVAMGWCEGCSGLSVIEIKPTDLIEAELAATVARLKAELADQLLRTPSTRRRWWQFMGTKAPEVTRAEFNLSRAKESLASLRRLLPFMQNRESGSRCLECQSEQSLLLPALPIKNSFDDMHLRPMPLDLAHPGCGGMFTVKNDGLRFSVQTVSRAYDREGRLLSEALS